jgi:hypothetical protein
VSPDEDMQVDGRVTPWVDGSRLVPGVTIGDLQVPTTWFVGSAPSFEPVSLPRGRQLDWSAIRRALPVAPTVTEDVLLDLLDDQSGSMWGGSDALNLRDEAALIAVEHLASRRSRSRAHWYVRVTTFDQNSPMELPVTRLDSKGLRAAERSLLNRSPGGSSNLGPALRAVEAAGFPGRRLVAVMSDFQLFDSDVTQVLREFVESSADAVLALVFRSASPPQLAATRVQVAGIDPGTTGPAEIARHIVDFARAAVAPSAR